MGVPLVAIPGLGRRDLRAAGAGAARATGRRNGGAELRGRLIVHPERRAEALREVQRRLALPYAGEALSGAARSLLRSFVDPGPTGLWSAAASSDVSDPRVVRRSRSSGRCASSSSGCEPSAECTDRDTARDRTCRTDGGPCAGRALRPSPCADNVPGPLHVTSTPPEAVLSKVGAASLGIEPMPGLGGGAWLLRLDAGSLAVAAEATPTVAKASRVAAEREVGPPVLGYVDGWLISGYLEGEQLTPVALRRPQVLTELADLLCRWHESSADLPQASLGQSLHAYAKEADRSLTPAQRDAVEWAAGVARRLENRSTMAVPCHLDVVANLLSTDQGLRLIDFDYASLADPSQELGQLIWEAELGGELRCSARSCLRRAGRFPGCRRGNLECRSGGHLDGVGQWAARPGVGGICPAKLGTSAISLGAAQRRPA